MTLTEWVDLLGGATSEQVPLLVARIQTEARREEREACIRVMAEASFFAQTDPPGILTVAALQHFRDRVIAALRAGGSSDGP